MRDLRAKGREMAEKSAQEESRTSGRGQAKEKKVKGGRARWNPQTKETFVRFSSRSAGMLEGEGGGTARNLH